MTYKKAFACLLSAGVLGFTAVRNIVAQQDHPISIGIDYTYLRSNILPGCNCFNLNGGGAQAEYRFRPHLSIVGDFNGTHAGGLTPDGYALTQLTYTAGLRYHPRPRWPVRPFGEVLLGGAHALGTLSPSSTGFGGSDAFAFQTGGGAELSVNRRWTLIPARVDYLLTTFSNGAADHQNDLRVSAGVLYRFGH